MHLQHTDPEGAVNMAKFMNVKKSVGVHWGTWIMSDELCKCFSLCLLGTVVSGVSWLLRLNRQSATEGSGISSGEAGRLGGHVQRRARRAHYSDRVMSCMYVCSFSYSARYGCMNRCNQSVRPSRLRAIGARLIVLDQKLETSDATCKEMCRYRLVQTRSYV